MSAITAFGLSNMYYFFILI